MYGPFFIITYLLSPNHQWDVPHFRLFHLGESGFQSLAVWGAGSIMFLWESLLELHHEQQYAYINRETTTYIGLVVDCGNLEVGIAANTPHARRRHR